MEALPLRHVHQGRGWVLSVVGLTWKLWLYAQHILRTTSKWVACG